MSRWEAQIRAAIRAHDRDMQLAAQILSEEHGRRHQPGERADLCPQCQSANNAVHTSARPVGGGP